MSEEKKPAEKKPGLEIIPKVSIAAYEPSEKDKERMRKQLGLDDLVRQYSGKPIN